MRKEGDSPQTQQAQARQCLLAGGISLPDLSNGDENRVVLWVELCPQKRLVEILTLGACESDDIWK